MNDLSKYKLFRKLNRFTIAFVCKCNYKVGECVRMWLHGLGKYRKISKTGFRFFVKLKIG